MRHRPASLVTALRSRLGSLSRANRRRAAHWRLARRRLGRLRPILRLMARRSGMLARRKARAGVLLVGRCARAIRRTARLRTVQALRAARRVAPLLVRPALAVAALSGGLLLVVSDLSTIRTVDVGGAALVDVSAGTEHVYFALLLGLAAWPLTLAAFGSNRLAMSALVVVGLLGFIVLGLDLSHIHDVGALGARYEGARAHAGPALGFEIAGVLLVFGSGWCQLIWSHRRPVRQPAVAGAGAAGPSLPSLRS